MKSISLWHRWKNIVKLDEDLGGSTQFFWTISMLSVGFSAGFWNRRMEVFGLLAVLLGTARSQAASLAGFYQAIENS